LGSGRRAGGAGTHAARIHEAAGAVRTQPRWRGRSPASRGPNNPGRAASLGPRWYQATRHTFASQWVLAGGSIEKLKEILGHYSVVMTERYVHLKPELFTPKDMAVIDLDLAAGGAAPVTLGQSLGRTPATIGSK
jgi:integrase